MRFRTGSYRDGLVLLQTSGAADELVSVLEAIDIRSIHEQRQRRQEQHVESAAKKGALPSLAGAQSALKSAIQSGLRKSKWREGVTVCPLHRDEHQSDFAIDYHKYFDKASMGVGVEATFHHGEALTRPLTRLTIGHETVPFSPLARVDVGVVIVATEQLKGVDLEVPRMDPAVGSYERMTAMLRHSRSLFTCPMVIYGLEWADGGRTGEVEAVAE